MAGPSRWRASSTKVRRFGSGSLLTRLRLRLFPNSHQPSLSEIRSPSGYSAVAIGDRGGAAPVAIFIRLRCVLLPSPAHFEKILSKLARFWNPSPSGGERDHLAWVVHGIPPERAGNLMQGGRDGTGEESSCGAYC